MILLIFLCVLCCCCSACLGPKRTLKVIGKVLYCILLYFCCLCLCKTKAKQVDEETSNLRSSTKSHPKSNTNRSKRIFSRNIELIREGNEEINVDYCEDNDDDEGNGKCEKVEEKEESSCVELVNGCRLLVND